MTGQSSSIPMVLPNDGHRQHTADSLPWGTICGGLGFALVMSTLGASVAAASVSPDDARSGAFVVTAVGMLTIGSIIIWSLGLALSIGIEAILKRVRDHRIHAVVHAAVGAAAGIGWSALTRLPDAGLVSWALTGHWHAWLGYAVMGTATGVSAGVGWFMADAITRRRRARAKVLASDE